MKLKRLLAFAVGTAMIVSMTPAVVFADDAESSEPAETTVTESSEPSEKETPKVSETEPAQTKETVPEESSPEESKGEESTEDSAGKEPSVSEDKSALPVKTAKKAKNASVVDSGTCGKKVNWSFDEEGTLTVSGTGDMYNFKSIGEKYLKRMSFNYTERLDKLKLAIWQNYTFLLK